MSKTTRKKPATKQRITKKAATGNTASRAKSARPAAAAVARSKKVAGKAASWGSADDLLEFIENSPDILIRFDRETRILFVTKNIEQYSGIPVSKYIGKRYRDLGYPAHRYELVERAMGLAFKTGAPNEASVKLDFQGRDYVFNWRVVPERKKGRKTFDTVLCIGRNITDRVIATEELKISRERYHNFVTQSHEAIYCIDFDNPIDTSLPAKEQIDATYANAYFSEANEAMARIYGLPSAEMFRGIRLKDILGDPRNPINRALMEKMINSGYRSSDNETEVIGPDGKPIYLMSSNIGQLENGRLIRIWGTAIDITRIKAVELQLQASLKEKDILLKEIHHRVKNNLSVIAGLLSIHEDFASSETERAICDELSGRIQAMAMIHDRLYRSNDLSAVNFKGFVENLSADLAAAYRVDQNMVSLRAEIDDVWVPIRKAVPCGQILNELISNSLKHAFPRGASGEITVRLNSSPDNPARVCLSVSDNGPGFPGDGITESQTLGLKLVRLLAEQLGGSLSMKGDGGAFVSVEFPSGM